MTPDIKLEIFARRCQLKGLNELIRIYNLIGFSGAPTSGNVLNTFRGKDDRLTIRRKIIHNILINKTLDVELTEDVCFSRLIIAYQTQILMNFTLWVLALGWIG